MAKCCHATDHSLSQIWLNSTHYCVTRPQWVSTLWPRDVTWWNVSLSTLTQVMACCLNRRTLPEPKVTVLLLKYISVSFISIVQQISVRKMYFKVPTVNWCHLSPASLYYGAYYVCLWNKYVLLYIIRIKISTNTTSYESSPDEHNEKK